MKDINGKEIKAGDLLRHTTHGGICRVCEPGTDGYLYNHDGLILIPESARHQGAWALTEMRAGKGEVVE